MLSRWYHYISFLLLLAVSAQAFGQSFSYVYIQGDKQTPFYVKLEDQMQPRYSKNYCVISELAPGPINIEILFQQNLYPSQKFTIKVPNEGYRGFLLTHKDNSFSLYDLQQQFYLPAGNKEEDDHMPVANAFVETTKDTVAVKEEVVVTNPEPIKKTNKKHTQEKQLQNNDPRFLGGIELNTDKSIQQPADSVQPTVITDSKLPVANSDCPRPLGSSAFEDLFNKMQKRDGKSRLKFLLSKLDNCYSTTQVRILTKSLGEDDERFEFLKQAYPRVTDQSHYSTLESLLSTQEWKDQFHQVIK